MKALIVVDVENDFCEGGCLAVKGGDRVAKAIATYMKSRGGDEYALWIATKDWHIDPGSHWAENPDYVDSWPKHCEAGTPGSELHPALMGINFDDVVYKGQWTAAYSGFDGTTSATGHVAGLSLIDLLNRDPITAVDIVGLAFDYCVKATAIDASKRGFDTTVLAPLTAAVHNDAKSVQKTITELRNEGVRVQ